jgi:hypothetical protein
MTDHPDLDLQAYKALAQEQRKKIEELEAVAERWSSVSFRLFDFVSGFAEASDFISYLEQYSSQEEWDAITKFYLSTSGSICDYLEANFEGMRQEN